MITNSRNAKYIAYTHLLNETQKFVASFQCATDAINQFKMKDFIYLSKSTLSILKSKEITTFEEFYACLLKKHIDYKTLSLTQMNEFAFIMECYIDCNDNSYLHDDYLSLFINRLINFKQNRTNKKKVDPGLVEIKSIIELLNGCIEAFSAVYFSSNEDIDDFLIRFEDSNLESTFRKNARKEAKAIFKIASTIAELFTSMYYARMDSNVNKFYKILSTIEDNELIVVLHRLSGDLLLYKKIFFLVKQKYGQSISACTSFIKKERTKCLNTMNYDENKYPYTLTNLEILSIIKNHSKINIEKVELIFESNNLHHNSLKTAIFKMILDGFIYRNRKTGNLEITYEGLALLHRLEKLNQY